MSEPVHSFKEFRQKYGLAKSTLPRKHHLTSVRKSIYRNKLIKKKRKRMVRDRIGIQNINKFSDLPQARAYREKVPAGFSRGAKGDFYVGKGWHGNSVGHYEARVNGLYGDAKVHQVKPRAHRAFSIHQTAHGFELTPKSNVVDSRFDIPQTQTPSVAQEPQEVSPPVTTEFDLDKRRNPKFSISRGLSKTGTYADNIGKSYSQLRAEAQERRSAVPPTAEEVGAGALARDVRTAKFAGSKTVTLVKGGIGWLQARKKRKEQEKRDKLYAQAQEKAENQRIQRIELQTEMDKAKLEELKKGNPSQRVEQDRKVAEDAMSVFEKEQKQVKQLSRTEAEKEYARV